MAHLAALLAPAPSTHHIDLKLAKVGRTFASKARAVNQVQAVDGRFVGLGRGKSRVAAEEKGTD